MNALRAILIILVITYLSSGKIMAQDYFSDLRSNGTPVILLKDNSSDILFSGTGNIGDNSVKVSIYKQYWIKKDEFNPLIVPRQKYSWGWGLSGKAKVENGLGSLFSAGQLNPGFTGGGYLSLSKFYWKKDGAGNTYFGTWVLILSGTINSSQFQLYDPKKSFSKQLFDSSFAGPSLALSYVHAFFQGTNDVYLGASFSYARMNNFPDLAMVQIKNDSAYSNGAGLTRTVTSVNQGGDSYGEGNYLQYDNYEFRVNCSFLPGILHYQFGFVIYPSVDMSKAYKPKYNTGLSLAYFKQGNPSTAIGALYFEVNDIGNSASKKGTFLKRSFKVGFSSALNIFTASHS
jgi:hypothetical protein